MPARTPAVSDAGRHPARRHRAAPGPRTAPAPPARFSDDDLLLFLLTSTWELATGRPAPAAPPADMTEEELIEYWSDPADDPAPGRHPAPGPSHRPGPPEGPAA
ncbi:hypothetical protein ACFVH6_30500 [Spirillospora sp. NPDC127200]